MPKVETQQLSRSWFDSANWGLATLAFINLFNYLDRFVVPALFESLRRSELRLSDVQLGLLMTSFLIVYTLTAPVFGTLGDRYSRPRLIAFGIACWSAATSLAAFAGSVAALMAARASVGIGEAAYGTIAPSLLADYFPVAKRARVMAIFFCAIPVGSALGYVLGGFMDVRFGWRAAFFVAGIPGLILAALCLRMRDPPRGAQDAAGPVMAGAEPKHTYRRLLANQPYVFTVLGYAAYTFALGGLAAWMPAFLERVRGMPHGAATMNFGYIVVVTGLVGTFAGGWLGDYFARYSERAHLVVSAIATVLATPFVWLALSVASTAAYMACMVIAQLLMFLSTGPINASIVDLVQPNERASAVALSVFTIHVLGDVPSPYLIGRLSDASSLAQAVRIVPAAVIISGLLWAWAARLMPRPSRPRAPRTWPPS